MGYYNGTSGRNDAKSYCGCYDMSGNLFEWTSGTTDGQNRVLRGGSWGHAASRCQCTFRDANAPSCRNDGYYGFRLVLDSD